MKLAGLSSRFRRLTHFGAKCWEEGVDRCMQNFNAIYRVDIFCRLRTMHEPDRQTDHGIVTSIAIGEFACQRRRLVITTITRKPS